MVWFKAMKSENRDLLRPGELSKKSMGWGQTNFSNQSLHAHTQYFKPDLALCVGSTNASNNTYTSIISILKVVLKPTYLSLDAWVINSIILSHLY